MLSYSRRSHIEVIADILRIRGSKTAIMYGANLSYAQTQKYVNLLIKQGLLHVATGNNGRRYYEPTPRGSHLLDMVNNLETFVTQASA